MAIAKHTFVEENGKEKHTREMWRGGLTGPEEYYRIALRLTLLRYLLDDQTLIIYPISHAVFFLYNLSG